MKTYLAKFANGDLIEFESSHELNKKQMMAAAQSHAAQNQMTSIIKSVEPVNM